MADGVFFFWGGVDDLIPRYGNNLIITVLGDESSRIESTDQLLQHGCWCWQ